VEVVEEVVVVEVRYSNLSEVKEDVGGLVDGLASFQAVRYQNLRAMRIDSYLLDSIVVLGFLGWCLVSRSPFWIIVNQFCRYTRHLGASSSRVPTWHRMVNHSL